MSPIPPDYEIKPRRPRARHRWAFEQLEDRTLLATVPGADLAAAIPLTAPSGTHAGTLAPGAPVFFRIDPHSDALLIARVHAEGTLTRLSLLDSQGHLLVQSDGQSATNLDDLIAQHVVAGTDYLDLLVGIVGNSSGPVVPTSGHPTSLNLVTIPTSGHPTSLDLVTINAGSHTLTLNRNINIDLRGGDAATLPEPVQGTATLFVEIDLRGGDAAAPLVAVSGDGRLAVFSIREFPVGGDGIDLRGDDAAALLVADSGDGHLALLQGGLEEPDLPNPTALAMDDLGRIFGVSEGIAVAVSVILGLGNGGEGSVIPGLPMVPNEQQVAQLQPLSRASLAVVATLHSTSVEMTSNEIAGPVSDPDGETDPIGAEISGMAVMIQESRNPVARFLSGLDEAFSRARIEARQGSLFAPLARTEATEPKLRVLDVLLARWSPVLPQPPHLAAVPEDGRLDPLKPMAAELHR